MGWPCLAIDHVSIDDEENIDGSSEDDEEAENANRSQWIQLGEERASTWALQSHRDESDAISFERASMSAADMQAWPQHTTSAISRISQLSSLQEQLFDQILQLDVESATHRWPIIGRLLPMGFPLKFVFWQSKL